MSVTIDDAIATLLDLRKQHGNVPLVFGDCNAMHKVHWVEGIVIADLKEYYLESVHPDDNEEELPVNAVLIG